MTEKITYINAKEFETAVLKAERAVVDFYSTECPPCEALSSKYDSLSELYGDDIKFIKIFRQENRELAESLGVKSSPTVLFFTNGKQAQERFTGAVKRADIVKNLNAMLAPGRAREIASKTVAVQTECDLAILGAGPAGLTAAIYAAQAKLKTMVIDTALSGGQVAFTHQVSNFPGFAQPVAGYELMHFMTEQAKAAGAIFRFAVDVTSVSLANKTIVIDSYETITAKKVIVATGASPRPLGVRGEKEYRGHGISYCATCDAKYYQDKDVIVIGGGNSAVEESLFISNFARTVTIIHQFDTLQANKTAQEKAFANPKIKFVFRHEPREFLKEGNNGMKVTVEDLATREMKTLSCDGVFIFAGMQPNTAIFKEKLETDEGGYILTDEAMHTDAADVFACGDVRSKQYRQITTAASDGTIASIRAAKEIEA
ncbi:MAG: hypothetical protein A2219_03240 [Elusimicrobia bacterium RIFOXYA2_FULL_50_26]|nr:MAG: hypothetical protein A2219_03240 [Elusimicrobia bacterium RIFOXYA2_FULL_50_26]OGS23821.1 MAG: hypothetical protein A2314_09235 [Elusimicrobia bacterium RIFOXYB2_FULL_50_12]